MKSRIGNVIVTVFAVLGGLAGFLGSSGYISFLGVNQGFRAACGALQVGEEARLFSKIQRADVAKFAFSTGSGDEFRAAYLQSDCSKTFLEFASDKPGRR